tara:strand:+ start:4818 stop:5669 length:852 start_codon:yes stop_codon:yes gene_type:complete
MKTFKFGTYNLETNSNFIKLRKIILCEILKKKNLPKKYKDINNELKKIKSKDHRNKNHLMIKVENLILEILKDLKFENIRSLQYPANIRVVSNKSFPNSLSEYDTRHVHCDAWSGAPKDSYNVFIYIFASNKSPGLEIYKNLPNSHKYRNFLGNYLDVKIQKKFLKEVNFKSREGNMAIWETYTPHKTYVKKFKKDYFRISVDFRFKLSSPYSFLKNKKRLERSKTNHDLVYWSIQKKNKYFSSMKQKILFELHKIKKNKFFYNLRKTYISKYYKNINYGKNI